MIAADPTLVGPSVDWFALSPMLVLLGAAMVLLVVGALAPRWPRHLYALFTAAAGLAATILSFFLWDDITDGGASTLVGGALRFDVFSMFVTITIATAVVLVAFVTDDYLRREDLDGPEVYALYLLAAIGGVVMGSANDLVVLFLGLEILSIAFYVMAASHRKRIESQESGIKYFVLGGFSSAFFLYGIAMVYGTAGSTNFTTIVDSFNANVPAVRHDAFILAGVALLLVGLGFKVAAVPFHFWTPDVYHGAPTPVTAFMASVGKVAAFAAMLRVLIFALPHWRDDYRPIVWILAVLTVVVGSVMAVVQTNVKRMLAFSSISHAGFILIGVEAAAHRAGQADSGNGVPSALLYMLLYSVLVIGTFAVVTMVGRTGDSETDLASFRGLGKSHPVISLAMTVLLLAQAGVPLTSGFVAKFGVIQAAVEERSYAIAVVAMVASVIAAFLYLRIMISMWVTEPESGDDGRETIRVPLWTGVALTLSVGFTLVAGFFPTWLIDAAKAAVISQ
ncbi:MAG: NADH-quinone oxidoreductase subunit N [Actinomycetota bacterium]|nr:NADH-quinone oxidoreductase subunit N [Actinomycetota bacterium]